MMLEAILITIAIETKERMDAAVMNLPRAILHATNEDDFIMTMTRKLTELMVMVVPQIYHKYIITNQKGEPMLYMKVQKAMYRMLKSAFLFYKKLTYALEQYGF